MIISESHIVHLRFSGILNANTDFVNRYPITTYDRLITYASLGDHGMDCLGPPLMDRLDFDTQLILQGLREMLRYL